MNYSYIHTYIHMNIVKMLNKTLTNISLNLLSKHFDKLTFDYNTKNVGI